jgi:hypothetical protein
LGQIEDEHNLTFDKNYKHDENKKRLFDRPEEEEVQKRLKE